MASAISLFENEAKFKEFIKQCEGLLEQAPKILELRGKTIGEANIEQPTWMSVFDEKKVELGVVRDYIQKQIEHQRGIFWKNLTMKSNFDLNSKDKEMFVNSKSEVMELHKIYLRVDELYKKFCAVVTAFEQRGYVLRNLTELRVNSLDDSTL